MKIIHFVIDDKFIDGAITLFESDSRVINHYVITQRHERKFKYLKNEKIRRLSVSNISKEISNYDVAVLHSLMAIPIERIADIPKSVKVVWFAWGFDLYKDVFEKVIPTALYERQTKQFLRKQFHIFSFFKNFKELGRKIWYNQYLNSALNRIDYFSGVFPYEYEEIKKKHSCFKASPLDFYYGSKKFFIPEEPDLQINHGKKNVIIGNSGDASNNHLDVLQILKDNNCIVEGQLIIPLSYACEDNYADSICGLANKIYPNKVNALRTYLPLNDYLKLTSNCRVAIYAHNRQQASDNIFLQLLYGAKVYMSEKSLAYHYLKSIGLKVFSLEKDIASFHKNISDEDVIKNRRILSSLYSSTKLIDRVKKINDILMG